LRSSHINKIICTCRIHFYLQEPDANRRVDVPCVIFDGKTAEFATEMFVVINSTHTRINKSHLIDLYERIATRYDAMGEKAVDPLFADARGVVVQFKQGSTSLLQRKLHIGYSRAARLLDQLEEQGIVGPPDGSKPREVYQTQSPE